MFLRFCLSKALSALTAMVNLELSMSEMGYVGMRLMRLMEFLERGGTMI